MPSLVGSEMCIRDRIVAVLFVGIGSILLVSWKRGKRIDGILQMLFSLGAEEELKGDEMEYISNSLKQLIDNNAGLQESIIRQKPVTRGLLLERLLHGGEGVSLQSLEDYGICCLLYTSPSPRD